MKSEILKILAERTATLRKLGHIAQTLPDGGPVPWDVSDRDGGSIRFTGQHQAHPVKNAFGWRGWRRIGNKGGVMAHVKVFKNGVTVIIENAECIVLIDELIETASAS